MFTNETINALAKRIHVNNHQWWHDLQTGARLVRNEGNLLMLSITEIAEAVEGVRKSLMDDKLPNRLMEEVEMADAWIRLCDFAAGFSLVIDIEQFNQYRNPIQEAKYIVLMASEDRPECMLQICGQIFQAYASQIYKENTDGKEISFALYLVKCYCERFKLDLAAATEEKIEYNLHREDHKRESRLGKHGKKF